MQEESIIISAHTGHPIPLRRGQTLRVIDVDGGQVADLMALATADKEEWLSSGRSIDENGTVFFTKGHTLFSNRLRPMFTITEDTVGRHDFLFAPCSQKMFEKQYGVAGKHSNCLENLSRALSLDPDRIATPFNAFMHIEIDGRTGKVTVKAPRSKAGDYLELRAEMDLLVAVSACSAGKACGNSFGPLELRVTSVSR